MLSTQPVGKASIEIDTTDVRVPNVELGSIASGSLTGQAVAQFIEEAAGRHAVFGSMG